MTIGENVRARRGAMSRKQLAETSGVSRQTIAVLEQGVTRKPQKRVLVALAGALGCTMEDLLNGKPDVLTDLPDIPERKPTPTRPPMIADTEQERYLLKEFRLMPQEAQHEFLMDLSGRNTKRFDRERLKGQGRLL